jgi:hypothetical protein
VGLKKLTDSLAHNNLADTTEVKDSILPSLDSAAADEEIQLVLTARDTIKVPDSLKESDPLKYKYYIALRDSSTRAQLRDSLITSGDTLELHLLDSLYLKDSTDAVIARHNAWYASASRRERKKYDMEQALPALIAAQNRKMEVKDSIKAAKDSIIAATPRILETFAVPDSMHYKRIIKWEHDRFFHNIKNLQIPDTTYNYHFHDYPFFKGELTLEGVLAKPATEEALLDLQGRFLVANVFVNGKQIDFVTETKKDIGAYLTEEQNKVVIKVKSSLRNLLGPHHFAPCAEPTSVAPYHFTLRGSWKDGLSPRYTHTYNVVPFGVDKIFLKEGNEQ